MFEDTGQGFILSHKTICSIQWLVTNHMQVATELSASPGNREGLLQAWWRSSQEANLISMSWTSSCQLQGGSSNLNILQWIGSRLQLGMKSMMYFMHSFLPANLMSQCASQKGSIRFVVGLDESRFGDSSMLPLGRWAHPHLVLCKAIAIGQDQETFLPVHRTQKIYRLIRFGLNWLHLCSHFFVHFTLRILLERALLLMLMQRSSRFIP